MTLSQRIAVAALLLLGLMGALWSARNRMAVERANKTVALCVDDVEVRQLAALTRQRPERLLDQVKQAGMTHVAVSERTLGEFLQTGRLSAPNRPPVPPGMVLLQGSYDRGVTTALMAKLPGAYEGGASAPLVPDRPYLGWGPGLVVPQMALTMLDLGVGYDPDTVQMIREAGLLMVARPMPDFLLTPEAVEGSMRQARELSDTVLFNGVSVAGGAGLAKQTAEIIDRNHLEFAFVELVPQDGATNLAAALKYQIIRTHSISQEEMLKTSPSRGLDRFTLGVTERNIRLCYIRLMLSPQPDIVEANLAYVRSIHDALAKAGYQFGDPQPFRPLSVPRPALMLMVLGVVGGGLWLLMEMLRPRDCWFWGLGAFGAVAGVGASVAARGLAEAAFPLLAAAIFPTLAILVVASRARAAGESWAVGNTDGAPRPAPAWKAIGLVILTAALTALGGLLVAGMLSSSAYMMQIGQFRGVKLAQLLPLVLVLGVMVGRTYGAVGAVTDRDLPGSGSVTPPTGWAGLRSGLVNAGEALVKYWHAIAVFVVLGLVAFMIMRSGNESAVEVSGLELKLRAVLDQILVVRPRTKEILFGFPALLLGLTLLLRGRPRTAWVWLTFGTIGLISLTNTFCHLHTPLSISLLRVINGIWVGLLVGIVWLAAKWVGERLLRAIWWTERV
ncbi:DUF5693 family protein [bacterium]|nr:DUF5693 family protein [bacterium]